MNEAIEALRRFNRSFTQRIGVLDDSFLGSGRSLGAARLLYEIGIDADGGADVRALRSRLGLDSGYLSRLLRDLEHDGVVEVVVHPDDGRRRIVRLTASGRAEWADLDHRSDRVAAGIVDELTDTQRGMLTTALATADRLVRLATIRFEVIDPLDGDAQSALEQYFGELDRRFRTGFDPGDALTADAPAYRPPDGAFLVARDDDVVACGAVMRVDDDSHPGTAEIKRMWVHPEWRGVGLGRRTLARLEALAVELGHGRVILDTNEVLTEAIAMYERAGYVAIERYNDNPYAFHWFAKDLH